MADKDKKLRVILKLPSKSSRGGKSGISGTSASPKVDSHKFHATPVAGAGISLKAGAEVAAPNTNGRVATPLKKRKFKSLVEGDANDDHGGVCGAPISTPPVFKAPLPPLAKKCSQKRKEKPLNGVIEAPSSSPEKGQGATTVPTKKVLEDVLDKLKKKDTYGVFSEPVDAKLVPDYYDVIKEPMDFGTMYKKISKGVYYTLNLFEKDIMLICNNAMRYNGPETIYYKQARSIQDTARKALDVLTGQFGALEVGNSEGDDLPHSNKPDAFSIRREPLSDRSGSVAGDEPGYGVQSNAIVGLEPDAEMQDDHGAQLKPATLKDGRRPLSTDEYHRTSYKPRSLPAHGRGTPIAGVGGELYHLVPTGYQSEMAYAKSLSRFSAKLGAEGWKFGAHRVQRVLAPSVPFGQGWIGEHEAPPGTIFKKFSPDAKTTNPTRINQSLVPTTFPSLPGVSSTSHDPVTTASFVPTPKISLPLMITPLAQTAMDSLLTTVTSAMLASEAASQASYSEKSTMEISAEKPSQPVYQPEHSRGQGMPSTSDGLNVSTGRPLWSTSQIPASQVSGVPTSGMIMQTSSDSANGALSKWNGSTSQVAPTSVYSTAVRTVPTSASMNVGQDEASKGQAHNLGLLQADAMAREKMQSNLHISQAPRPTQYMPQPMYTNIPSYGLQPGSLVRAPYASVPTSSQPLPTSMAPTRALKSATSQPLQLQMGAPANYGLPHSRPVLNPTGLLQTYSSRPPPDLNMQPVDSPSTPQTPSQLKTLGTSQAGLSLPLG